ncbi:MAG: endonuclease [Prolixibacteraceae bacterium]
MNALKRNWNKGFVLACFCLFPGCVSGGSPAYRKELNILFYNTENFFDIQDGPLAGDDEFLPKGNRYWTGKRFEKKKNDIARVILASCGFNAPAIVGLAEVENRYVLESLTGKSPLALLQYRIIHKDSPDERGIDLALLYLPDLVRPITYSYFPLKNEHGETVPTREILYACFAVGQKDTVHVFFNHWPSRFGGQAESEPERILAARTLKQHVHALLKTKKEPNIVIMGDFNDQPQNKSLAVELGAKNEDRIEVAGELINLSAAWRGEGTIRYRQSWQVFDQIIVSDFLLADDRFYTRPAYAEIVSDTFLLEPDPRFKGRRPFRTYLGYRYQGGVSDHLPVRLKIANGY